MSEDLERAFSLLELMGVPRQRARTVSNGIDVLDTRYRKEVAILKWEIQRLRQELSRYQEKADAIYKFITAKNDGAVLAVITELSLDAQHRSALKAQETESGN